MHSSVNIQEQESLIYYCAPLVYLLHTWLPRRRIPKAMLFKPEKLPMSVSGISKTYGSTARLRI